MTTLSRLLLSVIPTISLPLASVAAQAPAERVGLVIVAHGADSVWNAAVHQTVAQVEWTKGPVRVAFLMGKEAHTASWDAAVDALQKDGVSRIVAVPFMVSTYGSHVRQIEFYAGKRAEMPRELAAAGHDHPSHVTLEVPVHVTPALDDAPELGEALATRYNSLDARDKKRPLMLIAHGPNDAADAVKWEANILATARELSSRIAPHPLRVGLLRDDAPAPVRAAAIEQLRDSIRNMATAANDSVLVLPVLISTGDINRVRLPADINGLPTRYMPVGLSPSPALARWVSRIAEESLRAAAHAH